LVVILTAHATKVNHHHHHHHSLLKTDKTQLAT